MNIVQALKDGQLLGAAIGNLSTWATWCVVKKAAFGIKLGSKEQIVFHEIAGDREPPRQRVRELWCVAGRRSGKSRMAGALAVYLALLADGRERLAKGEEGFVLVLAPSRAQATLVHRYAKGFIDASQILKGEIESETADEIRLAGNVTIACHSNSYRTVRGRTLLACIFDESAYWRDETSAVPDVEAYRAVLPALATTGGMLIGISSPYRRQGLLYTRHRDYFGESDPNVLVVQAPTTRFNPTIDQAIIAQAHADDSEAALAEWDAEFRNDLSSLLSDELIDSAIDRDRPLELPPQSKVKYFGFADASAGRHDQYCLCIGHLENDCFVADVVRGIAAPCDPKAATRELARLCRDYAIKEITGDPGEWVAGEWQTNGIAYRQSPLTRSQLYLEAVAQFARGAVRMPDQQRLIRELRLLERRVSRSGQDSVDHPKHGSDDYSNSLAGALWAARSIPQTVAIPPAGLWGPIICPRSYPYEPAAWPPRHCR
jgi:hypothetical protein